MKQTSIDAYYKVMESGLLSKRRKQVYEFIFQNGPVSMHHTWRSIAPHLATGGISTRFSELERMGLICASGYEMDIISKQRVVLWEITDQDYVPKLEQKKVEYIYACESCGQWSYENGGCCLFSKQIKAKVCK